MTRKVLSPLRMAIATLTAMILVVAAQTPAQAALPSGYWQETFASLRGADYTTSYDREIRIWTSDDRLVGVGWFQSDPYGATPGDAIRVCDQLADGWGLEVWLDTEYNTGWDRKASTRGYNSPYCSPWASGDIVENTLVQIKLCMVKGTEEYCTPAYTARA
ncbi:hypothetical protein [Micromonospora chersina]|uniref:hypothetical protein n=1 Tax=Micromonospora chersina TaxID=47854 RepID=UPI0033F8826D